MANLLVCDEIIAFIDERRRILDGADLPYQRKTFSFEDPHRCRHCQDSYITVETKSVTLRCISCFWEGVGALATDGQHRICGQCGRPDQDQEQRTYSATLDYNLPEAIAAAKEGCALYERLVDDLVLKIRYLSDWRSSGFLRSVDYKFQLWAVSYSSKKIHSCTLTARFTFVGTLPTGTRRALLFLDDLHAWTKAADPAAKYISSRPYERDVKSARSLAFARDCFRDCLDSHDRCVPFLTDKTDRESRILGRKKGLAKETVDIAHIPSRLIYVSSESEKSQVTLIGVEEASDEIKEDVSRSGYVTLSYCWGGDQPLKLTNASRRDLKNGIAVSKLPQTHQDAVWVMRKMGMKYLWIDALCIFQDSDSDKASEIARMASYYSCAKLCICAAAATRSTEGFLQVRKPSPYRFGPVCLRLRNGTGTGTGTGSGGGDIIGKVYVLQEEEEAESIPEPTTLRGWTLQESLLSRRILIFAQRQLYWCCVNSYAGCGGDTPRLVGTVVGNRATLVDNIHPMGSLLDRPTENQWDLIVGQYTRRQLGSSADKLLAISALANSLAGLCAERGQDVVYYSGLFVWTSEPASWLRQLLWYSAGPRSGSKRPVLYRCPSWSWAALDSPVGFDPRFKIPGMELDIVTEAYVDVTMPTAPFGSVLGGFLILKARMCPVLDCVILLPGLSIMDDWDKKDFTASRGYRLDFCPDTKEDGAVIEAAFKDPEPDRLMFLLGLYRSDQPIGNLTDMTIDAGLVVVPSRSTQKAFTRVGVFLLIRNKHIEGLVDIMSYDLRSIWLI